MTMTRAPLLTLEIRNETDVVAARQRARDIAGGLGFDHQDQTRIATAVSEIARNAFQYASAGQASYGVEADQANQLIVEIVDRGPGIPHLASVLDGSYRSRSGMGLGIAGARKLMDDFVIESNTAGTRVRLSKRLPRNARTLGPELLSRLAATLLERKDTPLDEIRHQNQELVRTLEDQRRAQTELELLNRELEETNRGVMVLYNELEEKAEALRRSHEAKSRFFSEMNHEVRTPINAIVNLAQLLLKGSGTGSPFEQEKALGYILKSAQQLSELVDDLLDLAKSEAGKMVVHAERFTVDDLFGGLRGMFRPLHTREEVSLVFEDVSCLSELTSDQGKISQILRNFISNALKFTEHGSVWVGAREVDDSIVFEVRDTGVGIPAEQHSRLFEPFVQLDNPRQNKVKGTGLGLSVTRALAKLLGGEVSFTSEVGVGSTFYAQIPKQYMGAKSDDTMSGAAPRGPAKRKVLIIDDDEVARYLLRSAIGNGTKVVIEVASGEEGLVAARVHQPNVIFLDLQMPRMDGYQVLDQLKTDAFTRDIPVVINTSQAIDETAAERLLARTIAVLSKARLSEPEGVLALGDALRAAGFEAEQMTP